MAKKQSEVDWFEMFQERCWNWINILGLRRYDFFFIEKELQDNLATTIVDEEQMVATILFNNTEKAWQGAIYERDEDGIDKVAFHEMMEVLLWPLGGPLFRYLNDKVISSRVHAVINAMQNAIWSLQGKGYGVEVEKE